MTCSVCGKTTNNPKPEGWDIIGREYLSIKRYKLFYSENPEEIHYHCGSIMKIEATICPICQQGWDMSSQLAHDSIIGIYGKEVSE